MRERSTNGGRVALAILTGALISAIAFTIWLELVAYSIDALDPDGLFRGPYNGILTFAFALILITIVVLFIWPLIRNVGFNGPILASVVAALCAGLWASVYYDDVLYLMFVDSIKTEKHVVPGRIFTVSVAVPVAWLMWGMAYLGTHEKS